MRALTSLLMLVSLLVLGGCDDKKSAPAKNAQDKTLKFIMSDVSFNAELEPILKQELEKQGFVLDWVVVNDIIQPNEMVDAGSADANAFQHEPYFNQFVQDHGLKHIVKGFYTTYTPSGLYSRKYKSLEDLPDGAVIGIPVDPANNGRALFMLRDHGLLKLRDGIDVTHANLHDIIENPRHFKFREVDQMMLQRAFEDVDAGFLFSLYAKKLGLDLVKDALAIESADDSPYKGIVAIRKDLVDSPKIKALQNAYASATIKEFYGRRYGNAIVFLDKYNK